MEERRQGHEDEFGAPAGWQAEESTAVVGEVEYHGAAPAAELEVALALAVGHVAAAAHELTRISHQKLKSEGLKRSHALRLCNSATFQPFNQHSIPASSWW